MGHHWREPHPQPAVRKPSPLAEFLGLFLGVFRPEGLKGRWMPFDCGPAASKLLSGRRDAQKTGG
jgi:hypothetical protein